MTAIAPRAFAYDGAGAQVLFSTGILTRLDLQRIVLRSPVASLDALLNRLAAGNVKIEHIYDF